MDVILIKLNKKSFNVKDLESAEYWNNIVENQALPTFTHFTENFVYKHNKENNFREELYM